MLSDVLLLVSIVLVIIAYIRIILIYFKTKKIKIEEVTGFDIAKELTSNYDEINIVESKEVSISKYNLKRQIIRLTSNDYNSNNIFTLSISSLLAGYSLSKLNKDKNIQLFSKVFSNIDYLNKSAPLAIIISLLATNIGDAKITIIILIIILFYQYLINEINNTSKEIINKTSEIIVEKENYLLIEKIQNTFLELNKISFITTLILILREIIIIIL